jgi:hypothetical protein
VERVERKFAHVGRESVRMRFCMGFFPDGGGSGQKQGTPFPEKMSSVHLASLLL